MLGTKTLAVDTTLTAPTDFATAQLAVGELELGFQVEEAEMLVDLELDITYSLSGVAGTSADLTLFVDGVDAAAGTNGLARVTPRAPADENTLYKSVTVRLAQGFHTVELRAKTSTGNITLEGATIPCAVTARRHSHPATLGHGVDSKVQLIQ